MFKSLEIGEPLRGEMERDLEQLGWRAKAGLWLPPQLVLGPRWLRARP